jgi:hypothetical protein
MMALATLQRSPLVLPRSPARDRVAAAAAALQHAVDALYEEAKEQARERARRDEEMDRRAQARVAKAEARAATRGYRLEVDAKWFWTFNNETLDILRAVAADAKQRGATSDARAIERHVDSMCDELEKVQAKEAAR